MSSSIRKKGDMFGRLLSSEVELFTITKVSDGLGHYEHNWVSVGVYPAYVEEMQGTRLARYQALGYKKPHTVRIRVMDGRYDGLTYNGKRLKISSATDDKNNSNFVNIIADIWDEKL